MKMLQLTDAEKQEIQDLANRIRNAIVERTEPNSDVRSMQMYDLQDEFEDAGDYVSRHNEWENK
jgi:hypothetical protein